MGRPLWVEPTKKSTPSDVSAQSRSSIRRPSPPRRSPAAERRQQLRETREARLRMLVALQSEHDAPRPRSILANEPSGAPGNLPPHSSMPLQYDSYHLLDSDVAALLPHVGEHTLEEQATLRSIALDLAIDRPGLPALPPRTDNDAVPDRDVSRALISDALARRDALMRHFTDRIAEEAATAERSAERAAEAMAMAMSAPSGLPPRRSVRNRRRYGGFDGLGDRDRSPSPEADGAWDILQSTLTPDPQPPSAGSSFARVEEPEPPCDPLNEPDAGAERPEAARQSGPLSRRSYADVLRVPSESSFSEIAEDPEWLEGMHHIVRGLASRQDIPDEWWAQAGLTRSMSWEEDN
ncbi:hypothetical protein GGR53DRAFT_466935 [Hypoxylon sp. FL1150]|nr:hypothetical protein GGR53DRAFT_466935 [Hypoxylon sp. FL1150]